LRVVNNIQDRIKTSKFTPDKTEENDSFCSEVTTEILKNKVKHITKLNDRNKRFLEDGKSQTEGVEVESEKKTSFKISKKTFKRDLNFEENNSLPIQKLSKLSLHTNRSPESAIESTEKIEFN